MIHLCEKCNQFSVLDEDKLESCPYCYDEFKFWFRDFVMKISIIVDVPINLLIEPFDLKIEL